jgi:hypothetical protein
MYETTLVNNSKTLVRAVEGVPLLVLAVAVLAIGWYLHKDPSNA